MQLLTEDQQREVRARNGDPARFLDPVTKTEYVVLAAEIYDRIRPLLTDEPLSDQEELFLLREAGQRAGWDDPIMDVYNDLDPRRTP